MNPLAKYRRPAQAGRSFLLPFTV